MKQKYLIALLSSLCMLGITAATLNATTTCNPNPNTRIDDPEDPDCEDCDCNISGGLTSGGTGNSGTPSTGGVKATRESLNIDIALGSAAFPGGIGGGKLMLHAPEPTISLATTARLKYSMDTSIPSVSPIMTSTGVPRDISFETRDGNNIWFQFNDNQSWAYPQGHSRNTGTRLAMVDANGNQVTSSPAYYELIYPNGNRDRFSSTPDAHGSRNLTTIWAGERPVELGESGIDVIKDSYNNLRQIRTAQCLADITTQTDYKYTISFYEPDNILTKDASGYYQTQNQPFATWVIQNPDTTNSIDNLTITRSASGEVKQWNCAYHTGNSKGWTITDPMDDIIVYYSVEDPQEENQTVTYETRSSDNTTAIRTREHWQKLGWGKAKMSTTTDPGGADLTTLNSYYIDCTLTGSYSRLETTTNPDGSWQKNEYDENGRMTQKITPIKNAPITADEEDTKTTTYSYQYLDTNDTVLSSDQRPRTQATIIGTQTVSRTYHVYTKINGEPTEITEQSKDGSAYGTAGNLRTTRTYYPVNGSLATRGQLKTSQYPDDRLETYTYEFGNLSSSTNPAYRVFTAGAGDYFRVTTTQGITDTAAGIANKTQQKTTITDSRGLPVLSETYIYTGGTNYAPIAWTYRTFDEYGHILTQQTSTGTLTEQGWAGCCGQEWTIDQAGTRMDYVYDAIGRRTMSVKETATNDIYTTYTYDAAGRRLSTLVQAGGLSQSTSSTYDLAGRLKTSTDQLGITTTYSYSDGGRITTVTRAGITNTTVRYLDGRTHYTEQNDNRKQTYDYGVNTDGTSWTKVYTGSAEEASPVWQKTTTDMLGRTTKTERPGYGGTTIATTYTYNTLGQLTKTTTLEGEAVLSRTLYDYNNLGEQTVTCQDINTNNIINLDGPDRVTESDTSFIQESGDWFQRSASIIYPEDGSPAPTTNSIRKTRLTGLSATKTSETISEDIRGNETVSATAIDRANKTVTQTTDTPDSTNDVLSVTVNGLVQSSTDKTGSTTTYTYDALGRRTGITDPRTGTSTTAYNAKGEVAYTEDAANNRTTYAYAPATGRRTAVTNALGEATNYHYNPEGQLLATWGNTYPVAYEYDAYDRMSDMYTLRDTNVVIDSYSDFTLQTSNFDRTQWLYDEATGLLTNKLYADSKGTAYTYTPDGKLATREWARGVTTTYTYDTCCAGSLTTITYSDNTPSVDFTYDRLGRQKTISDAQGEKTFTYNENLQLATETIESSTGVSHVTNIITRTYEPLGRSSGFDLNSDYAINYTYDPDTGRFNSVSSSVHSVSSVVNYSYLQNSSLISGISNSAGFATQRTYEPNRNLITKIENILGVSTISAYDYTNDEIGRRTQRIDTMATSTTNTFGYNSKSELISALLGQDDYDYNYDQIGNRILASSSVGAVTSVVDYLSNPLNQYTNISNGTVEEPTYDDDGNMLTNGDWTFTYNGENRLVSVTSVNSVVTFSYDYMGRRFQKTSDGVTNSFIYDGWAIIREESSSTTNDYVYGLDLSGSMQGAGTIGGTLSASLNGTTAFYCYDANGNVTDLVGTNGTSLAHYEYDPFGQTIVKTGSLADANPFKFSTKYLDAETDLYYYGLRYYSPELGRWVNRDPIGEEAFWLLYIKGMTKKQIRALLPYRMHPFYAFVLNQPATKVDATGLSSWDIDPSCDAYKDELEKALDQACDIIKSAKFEACLCGKRTNKDERFLLTSCLRNTICANRTTKLKCETAPYSKGDKCKADATGGFCAWGSQTGGSKATVTMCFPAVRDRSKCLGGVACALIHEFTHNCGFSKERYPKKTQNCCVDQNPAPSGATCTKL